MQRIRLASLGPAFMLLLALGCRVAGPTDPHATDVAKPGDIFMQVPENILPPPTSCTLDYIPYPHYLHVQWVNGDASASTEVWIMESAGSWQLIKTASPGTTQEFHVVGPGLWYARVRHVKAGWSPSAYCYTNAKTVP